MHICLIYYSYLWRSHLIMLQLIHKKEVSVLLLVVLCGDEWWWCAVIDQMRMVTRLIWCRTGTWQTRTQTRNPQENPRRRSESLKTAHLVVFLPNHFFHSIPFLVALPLFAGWSQKWQTCSQITTWPSKTTTSSQMPSLQSPSMLCSLPLRVRVSLYPRCSSRGDVRSHTHWSLVWPDQIKPSLSVD